MSCARAELSSGALPSTVAPSLKTTVPVGKPAPGATTPMAAVSVTDWPKTAGLAEEVSAVVVSALLTVWATGRLAAVVW